MRIELNAGGIGGSMTINGFQSGFSGFITKREKVIESFKTVKQQVYNTRGGVGTLSAGLNQLQSRINREESKKQRLKTVQKTASDFVDLAIRVDKQVASLVNKNKNQLYQKYPHLKPVRTTAEKAWYEKAWGWICGKGEAVVDGIKKGFEGFIENAKGALKWLYEKGGQFAKLVIESHILAWKLVIDGAKKLWNGALAFYQEHKEIIDKIVATVVIVVGAIASIAAVVLTGGLALVPLLSLFMSTTLATTVSLVIAGVAVVSTIGASLMNVADTWCEINNDLFNRTQNFLNFTSAVTNAAYSIGNIYNSFTGVDGKEFIARKNAIQNGKQGYGNLDGCGRNFKVENGRNYSKAQKDLIREENMRRNGGVLRDDLTGKKAVVYDPRKGGPKPTNAVEIDHIYPRSNGGPNSFANARVINAPTNLAKSNNLNLGTDFVIDLIPDVPEIPDAIKFGIGENISTVKWIFDGWNGGKSD